MPKDNMHRPGWFRILIIGRNPRLTLIRATILAVLTVVVFKTSLLPVRVEGTSMLPTYQHNRRNFVNRLAYIRHAPKRGDVVGIRFAGSSIMLLKRVVGLPGEYVGFAKGRVTINGESLDEPYIKLPSAWEREPVLLGSDDFFVVGDNRSMPMGDHTFGIAKRERILGKVLL